MGLTLSRGADLGLLKLLGHIQNRPVLFGGAVGWKDVLRLAWGLGNMGPISET